MASLQSRLIDFCLRRNNPLSDYDPPRIRALAEEFGKFARPHKNVRFIQVIAGRVPSEWLIPDNSPADRALLYIHGGAWFMGSTNSHRGLVSQIAYASGIRALSINYSLSPEHPFPAGLEDCIAAYEWLRQSGVEAKRIVVAGDSAGGNLTLALLVALRDTDLPLPAGAIALSPATDLAFTGESLRSRLHLDPIFSHGGSPRIIQDYITIHDPHDPLISPLYADLHGLPPILIHVGDHEVLLDDTVRFGERAAAAGVNIKVVVWPEMVHVFQIYFPILPEARQSIKQVSEFIRTALENSLYTGDY